MFVPMYLGIGAIIVLLSIALRLAAVLRLGIPLLYALVVPTLFSQWFYVNYDLAYFIWYALLALTLLSWVFSLIRKIREIRAARMEERFAVEILHRRIRNSAITDENGWRAVNTTGIYR